MAFEVTLVFNQIEDYEKDDSQAENSVRIGIVSCWHAADAYAVFYQSRPALHAAACADSAWLHKCFCRLCGCIAKQEVDNGG